MRASVLALGLVAVLSVPASAAQGTGPFRGDVAQGETDTHVYDNNPSNNPCLQITATYVVTLTYLPGSDTLTLGVPGKTSAGQHGSASATVTRGICTEFPITVTGTSVASSATYVVSVTRQVIPPIVAT